MDRIICITDGTNAALHALALAALQGGSISASAAASRLNVSPTYLSKILQGMAAKGIIESSRGQGGGFSLKKRAGDICCLDVVEALEGPLPERHCLFARPVCASGECAISALCASIQKQVREALASTSIEDIARNFAGDQIPPK